MRWTIGLLLLLAVACDGTGATTTSAPATTTTTAPSTSTTTSTATPTIGCPQDAEFVASGQIDRITQPSSDSRTLGLVSRQVFDGCERFGFYFDTAEGAPATTPPSTTARFLDGERIIRITLEIDSTVITDQLIETRLVDRIYVVRGLDGAMFVDLHLREKANARIAVSNSPARLTLELNPGSGDIGPPPALSDRTVLVVPPDEATVDGEFEVAGYARVFEASVLIVATRGNEVIFSQATPAADWTETWGEFETEVTLAPGAVNLFVGEQSPQDGSLQGVTLNLTIR
ncbi:MAG: hypothetical protein DWQ20_01945 [Actinobacteria bacterium]|nr:MAG: hypothetical protein DWQ20_01945 [Actinomycetota bacterium]